ncbi:P-loop containing nucleoside triphosphate hydrolase protein [Cystobasidium minutum MCA 4210]|uniref:P-loop containing nucleoside triphosphate hydrolase protein n=1 Tax=Cystobasidium minutum MCA 4210 TaxID=1397322 RepID=UPI0034CFB53D|eukprot:jgi/Rhomi1/144036/e_gw1.4.1523.1
MHPAHALLSESGPAHSFTPPLDSPSTSAALDKFAPVYVPLWLRQIAAAAPARIIRHPPAFAQDGHDFAKAIFPKTLYETIRLEKHQAEKQVLSNVNLNLDHLEKLENTHLEPRYASKLLSLQIKEFQARKLDLAASTLYNVAIRAADTEMEGPHSYNLFKLEAPEIREGYPMLEVNDVVFLRHLQYGQNGVSWNGIVMLAEVRAIKRAQALIIIRCNALHGIIPKNGAESFIVGFEPQGRPYYAARSAIIDVAHHLREEVSKKTETRLAQSWLFSSLGDSQKPPLANNDPPPQPKNITWKDPNLNLEQMTAIKSLAYHRRTIPYLVQGPPGTGKTKTIVEAVLQIIQAYPTGCILLCGASNPSTDTLATRLAAHLSPSQMFRLNDESRPFDEVGPHLLPYCRIVGDSFALPDFATLRKFRVIVTSALDASVLTRFMFTNDALARLEETILSHWQPEAYQPKHYHFDYFILDEAAQLAEQDILPALSVMLPSANTRSDPSHRARRIPQVCLVGDFQQLGPFVTSAEARTAEMDLSLLQRLFERSLYKNHPKARKNLKPQLLLPSGKTEPAQSLPNDEDLSAPLCNLLKNYRSHVGLLMIPSSLFYDNTLQPCAGPAVQRTPLLNWPGLTNKTIPLLLWHTEGTEDMVDEGSSWFSEAELERVVATVSDLVTNSKTFASTAPLKPSDISVISPFREQVWKIRIKLRLRGLGEVNVGRESDMQGAENRVVIISTVRSSQRFVADDRRRNRGLLFEPKRFNVATTRAKELMVVIGSMPCLYQDPFWRTFIQFSIRRNCFKGPDLSELGITKDVTASTGRLEELFVQASDADKDNTGPEILAGSMARTVLQDDA